MFNLSLPTILLGVVGIVNLSLAVAVFRADHKSATNRLFILLGLDISVWLVVQSLSLAPGTAVAVLWLIRFSNFFATSICLLFLLLADTIPSDQIRMNRRRFIFLTLAAVFVMAISLTPLSFSAVDVSGSVPVPTPGPGLAVFMVFVVSCFISVGVVLFRRLRASAGEERQQLMFLMLGILSMLFFIITTIIIPLLVFKNSSFVPLFPLYTLFFTGATAYSIVRHRLFDVKVIATEIFSVTLWAILLTRIIINPFGTPSSFIDLSIFVLTLLFGIFLIRSVRREVAQNEELQVLTKRLEDLDKKKDEFLNVASHELRAPMTAIKGYISMVMNGDGGEVPTEAHGLLADAEEENDRMIRLVSNMLNVARIEEGRMVYEPGTVNLSHVVSRVFNEFKFDAKAKNLEYIFGNPGPIHDLVVVDIDRIHEVVANLINNAVKYTDEGKVVVRILNPVPNIVRVEVQDTGPGLSPQELQKLFQKFYRAESNIGKKMGTGLGLYISKLLVEKFGGRIGVKSEQGKGSIFWFELPVKA